MTKYVSVVYVEGEILNFGEQYKWQIGCTYVSCTQELHPSILEEDVLV